MKKNWITYTGVFTLAIVICLFIKSIIGTTFEFQNFPLREKWFTRLDGNIQQISIVDKKIVLARTRSKLYALDTSSGKVIWNHTIGWQFVGEPAWANEGIIYLTDGKEILALNQSNGKILWNQRGDYPESTEIADISDGIVAVSDGPDISLYRAKDGNLIWSKLVCRNFVQAHFYGTIIYIPCFGLSAININSEETVWNLESDYRTWVAAYANEVIYSSPDLKNITAFDLKNHRQLWSRFLPNDRNQRFTVIEEFLVMTDNNQICILHRSEGEILWCSHKLTKPQNPVKIDTYIYIFTGTQNEIIVFDISSGTQIGKLKISNLNLFTIFRQLMVSSDELLIFGSRNEIFAFGK